MREKLIELILKTPTKLGIGRRNGKSFATATNIADHLIANGVVISNLETTTAPIIHIPLMTACFPK